jgi:AcrR family transcriptional regulator
LGRDFAGEFYNREVHGASSSWAAGETIDKPKAGLADPNTYHLIGFHEYLSSDRLLGKRVLDRKAVSGNLCGLPLAGEGDETSAQPQDPRGTNDGCERMSQTVSASQKRPKAVARAGYRKGEETRQRILDAALNAFGEAPFKAVTTRQISEEAGVSLPTLQYYFGDKEGLYRACAEAIVDRYRRHTTAAATRANEALSEGCTPQAARAHLKAVIGALAELLVGSSEVQRWAQFVGRELRDPGPAFDILYEKLWRPGIETTAGLIARIQGSARGDQADRIQALLLISSVQAFQPGRSISLRAMRWPTIGAKELAMVLAGLNAQIDAIGNKQRTIDC